MMLRSCVTDTHRESEVTLRQSDSLMASLLQTPPIGIKLTDTIAVSSGCYSVSHHETQIYMGVEGGVDLVTPDGLSSRIISLNHDVYSVCLYAGEIYALVYMNDGWGIRVYGSDYHMIRSWKHKDRCGCDNQLVVKMDSVLVPAINSKTITQYSLTGELKKTIHCHMLQDANTWLCVRKKGLDTVTVSCSNTVSCIDVSTGTSLWSTSKLEKPTAVCCDDDNRVYVAVGGHSDRVKIAVLDGDKGRAVILLVSASRIHSVPIIYHRCPSCTIGVHQYSYVVISHSLWSSFSLTDDHTNIKMLNNLVQKD